MTNTFSFADRFSYPQPDGISVGVNTTLAQTLTDEEIEQESPELKVMADMVRQYSVLLKRTRTLDIFNIITTQSDPRCALILAAAKRKSTNLPIFKGIDEVKQVMFNDGSRNSNPSVPLSQTLNNQLFSDGVRRVSAAMTAAILIGQLPEIQREYALDIEKRAIEDLDRIIATYEAQSVLPSTDKTAEPAPIAFFFEPKDIELDPTVEVALEWYSPSIVNNWIPVQTYTGKFSTWHLVSDLADSMNMYTSQDIDKALLASAELSGPLLGSTYYHTLSFYPRKPINGVLGYSINVKIETRPISSPSEPPITMGGTTADEADDIYGRSPFEWGPYPSSIDTYPINGKIIVLYFGKSAALDPKELNDAYIPTVLYFRNKIKYTGVPSDPLDPATLVEPPQSTPLTFRVQPWHPNIAAIASQPVEITVPFDRLLEQDGSPSQVDLDNSRYSQIAVRLLYEMSYIDLATKATGCIVRNDPVEQSQPLSGLELVAWGLSKSVSHIVLDVLEIPKDIEMATGDLTGPKTSFSSNPRSLRVKVQNEAFAGNAVLEGAATYEPIGIVPKTNTKVWRSILEEASSVEDSRYY
jgi:hypothetical protein